MYFFTADEHYGHRKIIEYCKRPFRDVNEMDEVLIQNHNKMVGGGDVVVHVGDFSLILNKETVYRKYVQRLNGTHIFIRGSHDRWLPKKTPKRWEREIDGQYLVADHYAMRVWRFSHYNSWQVYGHSHGGLPPQGKQWDVGVDNNNYYPVSWDQLVKIMSKLPDNFNLVKGKDWEAIQAIRKRGG